VHRAAALAAQRQKDVAAMRRHFDLAEQLYREASDDDGVARSAQGRAVALVLEGNVDAARAELESALALARPTGSVSLIGTALVNLVDVELQAGEYERAATLAQEALGLEPGAFVFAPLSLLYMLALAQLRLGDERAALATATRALSEAHESGAVSIVWYGFVYVAEIALALDAVETAAMLLAQSEALAERFDFAADPLEAQLAKELAATLASRLRAESLAAARERGAAMTTDEAVALALSLD
jgi:tetratricopeptide (TPR) repeat protein